ncbi:MAG TPA: DsbA family protein [Candidatus Nitrosopelagicus sp.]|jgi:protein-disulfide isomerase|nr:DsbA family protein [Candidatus Nitrosopelagicus sp.]|tara:strand:- start:2234 stop:2905 length:672 start_codon:yes stop_codon:yes gene_type:complete
MVDKKKLIVVIVGIAIVSALGASFSSYVGQVDQMTQDIQDESDVSPVSLPPLLGSQTAPVTIIEMGDYQCEMCKRWYDESRPKIIENFIDTGKANMFFIDYPILGVDSALAAEATYCADDQGKYWDYHVTLYDYQGHMNSGWANAERLKSFAFNLDLNMDEFEECLDSSKYDQRVKLNWQKASAGGANSTPTFIIVNTETGNEEKIVGAQPYAVFEKVINSML